MRDLGMSRFDYLARLETPETVPLLKPDSSQLRLVPTRSVIVTALSDVADTDCVSRFFALTVMAMHEDLVTGSSHCCLGPYWVRELGKTEVAGLQVSTRTGTVRVRPEGELVLLAGQAATALGELA